MQNNCVHPCPENVMSCLIAAKQVGPAAKDFSEDLQASVRMAKQAWTSTQQRQAQYANQKRCDVTCKVGDALLLSTKNIRPKTPGAKKLFLSELLHIRYSVKLALWHITQICKGASE